MRFAWFIQELKKGGGHRVVLEISQELTRRGHQVTIMVPKGRRIAKPPASIEVIECGWDIRNPLLSIPINGLSLLKNLPAVDVVFSTMPYMGILNTLAHWLRRTKAVHFVMADDYHLFDDRSLITSPILLAFHKMTAWISYRLPIVIIANSQWTKERVAKYGPEPKYVLHPGVNLDLFKPKERSAKKTDTFRITTMPRKHIMKGWGVLSEALNLLWLERQDFEVIAITQDPISYQNCRFPITSFSPKDDTELVGYLQEADLFATASTSEGISLPPLEAMACGIPVVGTDIGGIREYAVHGVNAWLVPVNSPHEMKDGIQHLVNHPELRKQLTQQGIETTHRFTWQVLVDKLEQILEMPH